MSAPDYRAPELLANALGIKREFGADARVVAGGTDLILRMRDKVLSPKVLIDLRRISLASISRHAGEMHLGAYVTLSQMLASAEVRVAFPALVEACRSFAGPPIRNRATLGGNIVNASPAADLVPPLIAYDASVVLASLSASRVLPLMDFFTGPGKTVMEPHEVLTEVRLPLPPPRTAASFTKLGQRRSMAIAIVNLSARLTLDRAGQMSEARIVLGSVAPTAMRARAAEAILTGNEPSDEQFEQAANMAVAEISPISDVRSGKDYRKRVTGVLVRRALMAARHKLAEVGRND
ncbi:MAG: xanthine dehydrogenase family protein subunit M [Planctomycetes bacterium]|nr:xanthine dehydrogenase family protein subunit M [Planctomycetota bacterium]